MPNDGLCDVPEPRVYDHGVLNRCTYEFGHSGKHSWQKVERTSGWTGTPEDTGKLGIGEAGYLREEEEEPFCACGRRMSQCDGSRRACAKHSHG